MGKYGDDKRQRGFVMEDVIWDAASARAKVNDTSVSEIIRLALEAYSEGDNGVQFGKLGAQKATVAAAAKKAPAKAASTKAAPTKATSAKKAPTDAELARLDEVRTAAAAKKIAAKTPAKAPAKSTPATKAATKSGTERVVTASGTTTRRRVTAKA